jgi:hypothetical protein
MQKIFNNILVPVLLNGKTGQILESAIQFSNRLDCHLHLIFVSKQSIFTSFTRQASEEQVKAEIHSLQQKYSFMMKKGLKLFTAYQKPGAESLLEKYVERQEIDLVLSSVDLKSYVFKNIHFPAGGESTMIHCPILTIRAYQDISECRTIILPVSNYLPVQKIRVAIYLAKHFEAEIHLVVAENHKSGDEIACMKRAFKILKDNTGLTVVCNSIPGKELAQVVSKYAGSVKAGLILMDPGAQSPFQRILTRIIPKWTQQELKVPVITMS